MSESNIYKPDSEYFPTEIVGSCSICHMVCQLDIPMEDGFLRTGDALMNRKPIPAWCPKCRKTVEFIPSDPAAENHHAGHKRLQVTERGLMKQKGIIR